MICHLCESCGKVIETMEGNDKLWHFEHENAYGIERGHFDLCDRCYREKLLPMLEHVRGTGVE